MRKRKIIQVLIGLVLVAALVLAPMACKAPEEAPPAAPPEEVAPPTAPPGEVAPPEEVAPPVEAPPVEELAPFRGLADIPEIENKRPIHVIFSGFTGTWLKSIVDKFIDHTGVPVTLELVPFPVMYAKINLDLITGTGACDVFEIDSPFTCEWAPYCWDLYELAEKIEGPGGAARLRADMDMFYPAMIRAASDRVGKLCAVPSLTFHHIMYLRQDVFDDPTEQANFKAKYGYELAVPATYDELYNQAEFFTRKKGELLKGEPLEWDLYGAGIQGIVEVDDSLESEMWGRGGDWLTIIRDEEGRAIEYVITRKNKEAIAEGLASLKKMLYQWAPPGCKTGYWDYMVPEFIKGRIIIMPHLYDPFIEWVSSVYDEIPGAEVGFYPCIGGHGYTGNFCEPAALASKNPEASYWLLRYISSYEAQKEMFEAGCPVTRMDILRDPKYQTEEKWARVAGPMAAVLDEAFTTAETAEVLDNYFLFNTSAGGKIREMRMMLCHEAVTGIRTVDDATDELVKQMIDLQTKFGDLPIREEF